MAKIKVGDVFKTNEGYLATVVEYRDAYNVIVEFESGNLKRCVASHLRKGSVKSYMHPSLCGVGFLGSEFDEPIGRFKSYKVWYSMLQRCYDEKFQTKQPTYIDCSVTKEWHNYSVFKAWYDENYVEGYQLDKDIKVKGSRVYSPDTCLFVSSKLNNLLTNIQSDNSSGYIGVCYNKPLKRYVARIRSVEGNIFLGYATTASEAYELYKTAYNMKIDKYKVEFPDVAEYLDQHKL